MNDWISVDVVCMLLNSMITEREMQLQTVYLCEHITHSSHRESLFSQRKVPRVRINCLSGAWSSQIFKLISLFCHREFASTVFRRLPCVEHL